ncbi:lytic transglycosylase domain-containing protein [Saccharibacillus sp. CPCC 101409]|uniref:lytic transglycosylase domain-containing protein n=1 Tax=Saccharibacillus sp. CPCC 101409 TaxID=3058041 RepID=UPI0026719799|nr:lytic transglycosylase domain-containing protein [Saccharibacillus sp. CPCC 101409]MDO3408874.1 lytic transglycosylase domain-containing protein [Saccharibacillus sp. CPCC 101409]
MKIRNGPKKRFALPLFVLVLIVLFFNSGWMVWVYPIHYKEEIRVQSKSYDIDPFLIASIIRVETNFKPSKESRVGALGVMQLMPDTASWAIDTGKLPQATPENIKHEPDTNIRIGTWYLRNLSDQFGGNRIAVVAAYNAGPGNVSRWLADGTWDGTLENVRNIPIGETRHYVQRVVYYYNQYTKVYETF